MAVSHSPFNCHNKPSIQILYQSRNPSFTHPNRTISFSNSIETLRLLQSPTKPHRRRFFIAVSERDSEIEESNSPGVNAALSMLKFYKREISPLLPNSCRYVPTCSEYSMAAYKKYGVLKGTVLTAWRLCRCNPLGGSGFDPPRWLDEPSPPEQ